MQSQLEQEAPPPASLLTGIVHDAQELLRQQLTLFQVEVKNDVRRTVWATIPIFAGVVISFVAGLTLAIMAAEWIVWNWPHMPMWGAYAIVGGALAAAGGVCILVGKLRFESFNPLPEKSVEALKENLQWTPKT